MNSRLSSPVTRTHETSASCNICCWQCTGHNSLTLMMPTRSYQMQLHIHRRFRASKRFCRSSSSEGGGAGDVARGGVGSARSSAGQWCHIMPSLLDGF